MTYKEQFKIKLENILNIIGMTNEFYNFTYHFHHYKNEDEKDFIYSGPHSQQMAFIRYSLFRNTIIELAKLYSESDNDKYNLNKLLKDCLDGFSAQLKIPREYLISFKKVLDENNNLIKRIQNVRSNFYAHSKDYRLDVQFDISFEEVKFLIQFAEHLLNYIYEFLYDTEIDFNSSLSDRLSFIPLMVEGEKQRIDSIYKEFK
ncbi:hypothetical protein [Myroides odoratimimus]|uniref:AbiU2 domain-containing protein n=1 Tax=Myroides odoratimimus TaxID=76832 RepID=UPI002574C240|nr:hypothetical protein [Myroides odoratimimus]MDM1536375.1 hypothetical protein [Myroides odoratimimus]MDM1676039.1 hypothetical protein [Myroides odoratimimus]